MILIYIEKEYALPVIAQETVCFVLFFWRGRGGGGGYHTYEQIRGRGGGVSQIGRGTN